MGAVFRPGSCNSPTMRACTGSSGEGDTVVMMTDGVLDALTGENGEEQMKELIRRTTTPNAKEHARRLMERVYLLQKLQAHDDMTILIGKLWKKG